MTKREPSPLIWYSCEDCWLSLHGYFLQSFHVDGKHVYHKNASSHANSIPKIGISGHAAVWLPVGFHDNLLHVFKTDKMHL
jgi:hypothetical protein